MKQAQDMMGMYCIVGLALTLLILTSSVAPPYEDMTLLSKFELYQLKQAVHEARLEVLELRLARLENVAWNSRSCTETTNVTPLDSDTTVSS